MRSSHTGFRQRTRIPDLGAQPTWTSAAEGNAVACGLYAKTRDKDIRYAIRHPFAKVKPPRALRLAVKRILTNQVIKRTVETRWFFQAAPMSPESMFGMSVPPSERTDWYAFPCHQNNGLKFREGRLETKLLIENYGSQTWGHVSGTAESWTKWAADYSGELPSADLLKATGWVAVHKSRRWQVLDMQDGDLHWRPHQITDGCEVEWSVVTADGQTWWTVGFEAVGPTDDLNENLRRAIVHVLGRESAGTPFCTENSMAYPSWLWQVKTGDDMLTYDS